MCIIVCVKQVKNISFDSTTEVNVTYRKDNELFNNPFDIAALSWAMKLKEQYGFAVIAMSMGPSTAMPLVRQLFSYGVDRAILLTSPSLSGSDTYATSYAIGNMIKTLFPEHDLIICGTKSLDGETGQVPHSMAMELNVNSFANVSNISYHNGNFEIICEMDSISVKLTSEDKLLVTVMRGPGGYVYLPTIKNIIDSKSKTVEIITCGNLSLSAENVGQRGSYTKVISIHHKKTAPYRSACKIHFKEEQKKLNLLMGSLVGDKS